MQRRIFFKGTAVLFALPVLIQANSEKFTFSKVTKEHFAHATKGRKEIDFSLNVVVPKEAGNRVSVVYFEVQSLPDGEKITEVIILPIAGKYGRASKTSFLNSDAIVYQKAIVSMVKSGYVGVLALTNKNSYMVSYHKVIVSAHGCGE